MCGVQKWNSKMSDHQTTSVLRAMVSASGQTEADAALIIHELDKRGWQIVGKKCFSCGATMQEDCPRARDSACGRAFQGGSRKALQDV